MYSTHISSVSLAYLRFIKGGMELGGLAVWGRKSPSGVQGQSPGTESGDEVPKRLKRFCECVHKNFDVLEKERV